MNLLSKKLSLVVIAAAVALSGCTKKPKRPNPGDTAQIGPSGGGLNPNDVALDPTLAPGTDLSVRSGEIKDGNKVYNRLGDAVFFDFNSAGVKADQRAKLEAAHKYLVEHPTERILLEGHCDWRGTAEYNLGLGDRRAAAAKQYLESLGIPATRIETLSKGDLDAVENGTEDQLAKDRRVDLVVLLP